MYMNLGFAAKELLVEYGYPAQRFVLSPGEKEEAEYAERPEHHPVRLADCSDGGLWYVSLLYGPVRGTVLHRGQ